MTPCVPDYIQNLQDENKIRVEKIGSGNWYWSFASEDKKTREKALVEAESAHEKAAAVVQDLERKLTDAQAQRDDEAEMLEGGAESREKLTATKTELEKEVTELQKQLAAYSDSDPTELERLKEETKTCYTQAYQYTDDIDALESFMVKTCGNDDYVKKLREDLYLTKMDVEEGRLKEI